MSHYIRRAFSGSMRLRKITRVALSRKHQPLRGSTSVHLGQYCRSGSGWISASHQKNPYQNLNFINLSDGRLCKNENFFCLDLFQMAYFFFFFRVPLWSEAAGEDPDLDVLKKKKIGSDLQQMPWQAFPLLFYWLMLHLSQGWAPRSFPFRMFRSFPLFQKTFRSFPFFFWVFGDLWDPKERNVLSRSF